MNSLLSFYRIVSNLFWYSPFFYGGGDGCRTRVRKQTSLTFYERSLWLKFRSWVSSQTNSSLPSFINTPLAQSFARLRFLLYDTSYPRRRHPGLMSGYIKLLMQNYLLRLSLMHTWLTREHAYLGSLIKPILPPSKPKRPHVDKKNFQNKLQYLVFNFFSEFII